MPPFGNGHDKVFNRGSAQICTDEWSVSVKIPIRDDPGPNAMYAKRALKRDHSELENSDSNGPACHSAMLWLRSSTLIPMQLCRQFSEAHPLTRSTSILAPLLQMHFTAESYRRDQLLMHTPTFLLQPTTPFIGGRNQTRYPHTA